jgi:ABC-2 type transport system permease protein
MSELVYDAALPRRVAAGSLVRSVAPMAGRALRLTLRNVESLLTALALPVILMVMFVYLFGGAIRTGGDYVDFVVPGVLVVCAGFGAATTAVTVANDLAGGAIDRFRSLDVPGSALVNGHVLASVARNLLSTALVFGVAFAVGFRSPASVWQWLAALAIFALFAVALSWVAAALGVVAGSVDAANGLGFIVSFFAYPSSAFVPVATMPGWLQAFAGNQPVTPVVDSMRHLLAGQPAGASAWQAVAWSVGIAVVAGCVCGLLFGRRTG